MKRVVLVAFTAEKILRLSVYAGGEHVMVMNAIAQCKRKSTSYEIYMGTFLQMRILTVLHDGAQLRLCSHMLSLWQDVELLYWSTLNSIPAHSGDSQNGRFCYLANQKDIDHMRLYISITHVVRLTQHLISKLFKVVKTHFINIFINTSSFSMFGTVQMLHAIAMLANS